MRKWSSSDTKHRKKGLARTEKSAGGESQIRDYDNKTGLKKKKALQKPGEGGRKNVDGGYILGVGWRFVGQREVRGQRLETNRRNNKVQKKKNKILLKCRYKRKNW